VTSLVTFEPYTLVSFYVKSIVSLVIISGDVSSVDRLFFRLLLEKTELLLSVVPKPPAAVAPGPYGAGAITAASVGRFTAMLAPLGECSYLRAFSSHNLNGSVSTAHTFWSPVRPSLLVWPLPRNSRHVDISVLRSVLRRCSLARTSMYKGVTRYTLETGRHNV
jgi:hypothetical protein